MNLTSHTHMVMQLAKMGGTVKQKSEAEIVEQRRLRGMHQAQAKLADKEARAIVIRWEKRWVQLAHGAEPRAHATRRRLCQPACLHPFAVAVAAGSAIESCSSIRCSAEGCR